MRISTNQFNQLNQNRMSSAYSQISHTQQQVASGRKHVSLADSPFQTAAAMRTKDVARQNDRHVENIDRLSNRYSSQESALQSIITASTRLRDLSIQAGNQTLSAVDHKIIASEIQELSEMVVSMANSRDPDGEYLFAGYNSDVAPVQLTEHGKSSYVAIVTDDREAKLEVADDVFLSTGLTAAEVFARVDSEDSFLATSENPALAIGQPIIIDDSVASGEFELQFTSATQFDVIDDSGAVIDTIDYVPGEAFEVGGIRMSIGGEAAPGDVVEVTTSVYQDMFSQAFSFASALRDSELSDSQRVKSAQSFLGAMDEVLGSATDALATLGTRMNRADQQKEFNLDYDVFLQERISDFEGVDMAKAISDLEAQMMTLQAVQTSFARISGLSLFDRL